MKTAIELYQDLVDKFSVTSSFKVGFSKAVSPGVLELIKHLKGDLNPQDIVPIPTEVTVVVKDKSNQKILGTFHQSSAVYMESFDKDAFEWFSGDLLMTNSTEAEFLSNKQQLKDIVNQNLNNLN